MSKQFFHAFQIAQEIKNIAQGTNNTTQESEISGLQGQHDSLVQRIDTIESKVGTSFVNTNNHIGILEELKNVSLSTTFVNFDNKDIALGVSFQMSIITLGY